MAKANMARIEETMRLALAFAEAFNRHDVAAMTQAMHPDCRFESSEPAPHGTVYSGKAAIQQYWQTVFEKEPSIQLDVEDVFGYGFRSVLRWQFIGQGRAETRQDVRGVDIFVVKNGAIQEQFSYSKGNPWELQDNTTGVA